MKLLAIETSCDDASVAVVEGGQSGQTSEVSESLTSEVTTGWPLLGPVRILAERTASQVEIHNKYGGVFPELAAREHFTTLLPTIEETLKVLSEVEGLKQSPQEILRGLDAIAVTAGPGLIGSLLVGVSVAQALAMGLGKKLIPVNHLAGHIYSVWLEDAETPSLGVILDRKPDDPSGAQDRESMQPGSPISVVAEGDSGSRMTRQVPQFPALALTVSGGHTHVVWMEDHGKFKVLGRTRDDAAGEAFDKVARLLGLSYPGGPTIAQAAREWQERSEARSSRLEARGKHVETRDSSFELPVFPRPMIDKGLEFSFSGLKTAVRYWLDGVHEQLSMTNDELLPANIVGLAAYEVQESITDVLVTKLLRAAERHPRSIILAGGVAANTRLREKLIERLGREHSGGEAGNDTPGVKEAGSQPTLFISSRAHSTDNGAMIGAAALAMLATGFQPVNPATVEARSTWPLEDEH